MNKTTPGPWTIMNPDDFGKMKYLVGANGQGFAHTVGLRNPQDLANACLIAAAPDLLKILKTALIHINELCPDSYDVLKFKIRKVIAKAEGKDHA